MVPAPPPAPWARQCGQKGFVDMFNFSAVDSGSHCSPLQRQGCKTGGSSQNRDCDHGLSVFTLSMSRPAKAHPGNSKAGLSDMKEALL